MEKNEFSKIVICERKRSGMTLYDFADKIGTSWVTVWRWENQYCMPRPEAIDFWIDKMKN